MKLPPDYKKIVVEIESAEMNDVIYDLFILDMNNLDTAWLTQTKTIKEVSANG